MDLDHVAFTLNSATFAANHFKLAVIAVLRFRVFWSVFFLRCAQEMFCDSEGKEARLVSGRWQADVTVTEDDNCGLAMFAFEMWKVNLSISRSFPARLFLSFSLPCAQRPEAVFEGQQALC